LIIAIVPSSASSAQHCPAFTETGTLHAAFVTSLPTLHCALPTNDHAYVQVPLKLVPNHVNVVPFPQSIVIGVVAVALAVLQVRFVVYQLVLFVIGADQVIELHVAFISGTVTELQACPVTIAPS